MYVVVFMVVNDGWINKEVNWYQDGFIGFQNLFGEIKVFDFVKEIVGFIGYNVIVGLISDWMIGWVMCFIEGQCGLINVNGYFVVYRFEFLWYIVGQ